MTQNGPKIERLLKRILTNFSLHTIISKIMKTPAFKQSSDKDWKLSESNRISSSNFEKIGKVEKEAEMNGWLRSVDGKIESGAKIYLY